MSLSAPRPVTTLKKRAEFKRLSSQGVRRGALAFTLRAGPAEQATGRFGFTVTKKTGNAVERNRIRRRLKAAARMLDAGAGPDLDAVVIARRECLVQDFAALRADLDRQMAAARHRIAHLTTVAAAR